MNKSELVFGHDPVGRRPNVRKELLRLRRDPLEQMLSFVSPSAPSIFSNERTRYQAAYEFYYLSLARYLREMSVAARYAKGPQWVHRSGGTRKYSASQRRLAEQRNQVVPFLEHDLVNCVIHARILLDRVAALSRSFLTGQRLPSFTSFSDHKKFFTKLKMPYGAHEAYAEYIRNRTNWFEMPLKEVRDKFVVHSSPKHMRFLTYPDGGYELDLNIILPASESCEKTSANMRVIRVNALRLSYDLEGFLNWFSDYGLAALKKMAKDSRRCLECGEPLARRAAQA
jgi:hypothetical protein